MWILAPISAIASIIAGGLLYNYVSKQDSGTEKMKEIASAIKEGADAFLKREYMVLAYFVAVVAIVLAIFINPIMGPTYIFGSACSALAGFFGMQIALKANVRTTNAAREGLNRAFPIALVGESILKPPISAQI